MHVIPPAGQQVAVDSGPTLHSSNIVPSQLPQKDHSGTVAPGSNPGDYTTGKSLIRPGIEHLRRLQGVFRLGIFSSATAPTVETALPTLESAAGPGPALFPHHSLIFHRGHAAKAAGSLIEPGRKAWDTVKPLHKWFKHLHRVLLLDDDAGKAANGEAQNMILVHCWKDEEPEDMHLKLVVDTLLHTFQTIEISTDVRSKSSVVSEALRVRTSANVAKRVAATDAPVKQVFSQAC
ncbi:hypothetical protein WJX82_009128 [Trebouxia sp. C0006]